jgi:hypothetical protein
MFVTNIPDKGLISRIHGELLKPNNKKFDLKVGKEVEQTFLQRGYTNSQ